MEGDGNLLGYAPSLCRDEGVRALPALPRTRDAQRQRRCVALLDRICADEYEFQRDYFTGDEHSLRFIGQRREETKYVFRLLGRHLLTWWE